MKQIVIIIILALVASFAGAAPVAVGGSVVSGSSLDPSDAEMMLITSDGWVNLDRTGAGWKSIYAAADGDATVYVYRASAAGVVERRWGPMYLRDWLGATSLVPAGWAATDIQFESVSGTVVVTAREG